MLSSINVILSLTKSSFKIKYRDSFFGMAWAFLSPLLLVLIYDHIFPSNSATHSSFLNGKDFSINALCGLLIFNFFLEVLVSSTVHINSNANLIKKIRFPLNVLPFVNVNLAFITLSFGFVVFFCFSLYKSIGFSSELLLLFPILILMYASAIGISMLFSALGVYLKDLNHFFTSISLLLLFASPVFYENSKYYQGAFTFLNYNPIAVFIKGIRSVLLGGNTFSILDFVIMCVISLLCLLLGFFVYARLKNTFVDML